MRDSYTEINSVPFDTWVAGSREWRMPISSETFARARRGGWFVLLTPTKPVKS